MGNPRITQHAIDRYVERFCHKKTNRDTALDEIVKLFDSSKENKSFINNTSNMVYLCERYGSDMISKISFKENRNILFLCVEDTVVTVMNTDNYRIQQTQARKYN